MMGCCDSFPEGGRASVAGRETYNNSRLRGVCVIEIICANHLPNMDLGSLTDAYVTVRCMDSDNPMLMNVRAERTLTRNNSLDPVFHVFMAFPFIPRDADNIFFDLKDEDTVTGKICVYTRYLYLDLCFHLFLFIFVSYMHLSGCRYGF